MKSDFLLAVTQLASERGLPKEAVISAVEAALASAYKKDSVAAGQNITVRLNPNTGEVKVFTQKSVVAAVTDPRKEVSVKEARRYKKEAEAGDLLEIEMPELQSAGRIAAQTAKQVVLQRLREAERELIYGEFNAKVGDVVAGRVERIELSQVVVGLTRAEATLPREEQVPMERYRPGQTSKFLLLAVNRTPKGPEVILSRTHKNLLRRLLELEVPEIYQGTVEIKAIAREPGSRSKVAVASRQEGIDPVGSCVGLRGFRIQNIVNELQGEKIDVVAWHKDTALFIANALSPAQVVRTELNEKEKAALVLVPDKQLSLAIGKEGQNARLAAKLTGFRIDIKSLSEWEAEKVRHEEEVAEAPREAALLPVEALVLEIATAAAALAEAPPVIPIPEAPTTPAPTEVAMEPATPVAASLEPLTREVEKGALPLEEVPEETWSLQRVVKEPVGVRFAEEILPGRGKAKKERKGDDDKKAKGKKVKRIVHFQEEDSLEDAPEDAPLEDV
ncbi:MAG: transcription termination/antitermination protein NusA [Chloroflexi bacterium]|nr:transcription termination/antitermination protein NusA [Chloroflexota bacterium]